MGQIKNIKLHIVTDIKVMFRVLWCRVYQFNIRSSVNRLSVNHLSVNHLSLALRTLKTLDATDEAARETDIAEVVDKETRVGDQKHREEVPYQLVASNNTNSPSTEAANIPLSCATQCGGSDDVIVESTCKPSSQLLPIIKAPTKPWKSGQNDGGVRTMAWVMDTERELKLQSENIAAVKRRLDESIVESNEEWTSLMERVEEQVDSLSSLTTVLLHSMQLTRAMIQQSHAHATTTPGKELHAYPESVANKVPHAPHTEKRRPMISAKDRRETNEKAKGSPQIEMRRPVVKAKDLKGRDKKAENGLQIEKGQPKVTVKDIQAKREKAEDSLQIDKRRPTVTVKRVPTNKEKVEDRSVHIETPRLLASVKEAKQELTTIKERQAISLLHNNENDTKGIHSFSRKREKRKMKHRRTENSVSFRHALEEPPQCGLLNDVQSSWAETPEDLAKSYPPQRQHLDLRKKRLNRFEVSMLNTNDEWHFPINNQANIKEDRHSFAEHVFLDHHLNDFPQVEPVLKYMELVITGLQQNPHLSHRQKVGKIKWYKMYFSKMSPESLS